jgi:hypothetical protein
MTFGKTNETIPKETDIKSQNTTKIVKNPKQQVLPKEDPKRPKIPVIKRRELNTMNVMIIID